jgi:hypothetical protein
LTALRPEPVKVKKVAMTANGIKASIGTGWKCRKSVSGSWCYAGVVMEVVHSPFDVD